MFNECKRSKCECAEKKFSENVVNSERINFKRINSFWN